MVTLEGGMALVNAFNLSFASKEISSSSSNSMEISYRQPSHEIDRRMVHRPYGREYRENLQKTVGNVREYVVRLVIARPSLHVIKNE
ncbi:hypothetical protein EYZ11_008600 [Aspergillus tanneri]|uniref:Uncharacterized protein n=1 Tax=Aspergillus tanneri TaxID=1220188 RepID=A0A4S3JAH7_9EURO|nr:uncharacterized protein ATNIH1004_005495 [Aspergillus tanneri]KAA8646820.1 hypothetical protein ATNIH1004_005495 [Aspergillus tanneri]THC91945.1 hypothetical protein EYZ11_008600 [Aspergillus tanneri]